MTRYAFFFNAELCIGCSSCGMACKNQYNLLPGIRWRKLYPLSEKIFPFRERAFYSLACNHCDNPACLEGCPVKAYTQRKDGIVIHNQSVCIGCRNCLRNCPYGVPQYNHVIGAVEKCSMCWERLDEGLEAACVQACPTDALNIVDLEKFKEEDVFQYPPGFPHRPGIESSTRFKLPSFPVIKNRSV